MPLDSDGGVDVGPTGRAQRDPRDEGRVENQGAEPDVLDAPAVSAVAEQASNTTSEADVRAEMPIFVRTFDFLTWLLPVTNHFPRAHRHTFTRRLLDAAFELRERLEEANLRRAGARLDRLARADECLARVRVNLRLAQRWGWLSPGQYRHVSLMVVEIGRLLGGWRKATDRNAAASGV